MIYLRAIVFALYVLSNYLAYKRGVRDGFRRGILHYASNVEAVEITKRAYERRRD